MSPNRPFTDVLTGQRRPLMLPARRPLLLVSSVPCPRGTCGERIAQRWRDKHHRHVAAPAARAPQTLRDFDQREIPTACAHQRAYVEFKPVVAPPTRTYGGEW